MTRRIGLGLLAGMVLGFSGLAVAGDDLPTVEKKIKEAWEKHKSVAGKISMLTHMELGGMVMDSKGEGTFEFVKKSGKIFSRTELKIAGSQKMGDQETKTDQQITSITDGEFTYMLMETAGQKQATKSKVDPQMAGDPQGTFERLRKDHELKLLPEETVDGRKAFMIEATPKQKNEQGPAKLVLAFDQASGFMTKMVMSDAAGKPMQTIAYSGLKLDADINPERFVFKAPAGVEVMDLSGTPKEPAGEKAPAEGEKKP